MAGNVRIALVGDYDESVIAHRAIAAALAALGAGFSWKHTASLRSVEDYDGVWCVPASPYANEEAALAAIRFARTHGVPFLGTCGGFQHAIVEFARNVLGWHDATHEETAGIGSASGRTVIGRLTCPLVEVEQTVHLAARSRLRAIHGGAAQVQAGYHCNFGLDRAMAAALAEHGLRVSACDAAGEPRAVELDEHPFFIGTLWQPERAALAGREVPLARALVEACAEARDRRDWA